MQKLGLARGARHNCERVAGVAMNGTGLGLVFGTAVGLLIGVLVGHLALAIVTGAVLGLVAGSVVGQRGSGPQG